MTFEKDSPPPRKPRVFKADDVASRDVGPGADIERSGAAASRRAITTQRRLTASDINRGFRFGSILLSAMGALASLAFGLWFTRFVSIALERQDWVGWIAFSLMAVIGLAITGIVLRELIGFRRLARLAKLRVLVRATIAKP